MCNVPIVLFFDVCILILLSLIWSNSSCINTSVFIYIFLFATLQPVHMEHMDSTVEKNAVIVKTKFVTQYLVYVTRAVYLDGRVTNVMKVLNVVCNTCI